MLLALLLTASTVVAACSDPREPDMLVVAVERFGQAQCAPVPLQLIDARSESVRLGPADRYVSIAVSSSGRQIAAGRMDFDLCGPRGQDEEQTFTLVTVDTETLAVTEHRTTVEAPTLIHWSPDERHVALVEPAAVVIYDVVERSELARGPRASASIASRTTTYWPSRNEFVLLYFADNELIGIPRDGGTEVRRWSFDCDGAPTGFPRSIVEADGHPEVLYSCAPTIQAPGGYVAAVLDLDTGELGDARPVRSQLEDEVSRTSEMTSALRADFRGGRIGWTYYGDSVGRTLVYTTTYSRSGIDLVKALSDGMAKPGDLETVIAIRDLDGSLLYLPIDVRYDDEDFLMGPLIDVAILD